MLVMVITQSQQQFHDLVLMDVNKIGKGSTIFTRNDEKTITFRPSENSDVRIRYVWIKNYEEAGHVMTEDGYRVLGNPLVLVDKRPELRQHLVLFAAITCFMIWIFLR